MWLKRPFRQCTEWPRRSWYLLYSEVDVAVQLALRVNGLSSAVLITLQEEVFERGCVFLFKRHHHLVAEPEQHQLRGRDRTHGLQQTGNIRTAAVTYLVLFGQQHPS